MGRRLLIPGVLACACVTLTPVQAQPSPAAPAPTWARSVEVVDEGTPIYVAPRQGAQRRGRLVRGTRLAFQRRVGGDGCPVGYWYQIGTEQYICEQHLRPSPQDPAGVPQPVVPDGWLLPHKYAFVRDDATRLYARPDDYLNDDYIEAVGEGFGLVITGRQSFNGLLFLRTRRGLWVQADSMGWARGSDFGGVEIAEGQPLDVAWALRVAPVRASRSGRVVRRTGRREVVHVAEVLPGGVVRLTDGTFMRERDLARATASDPPEGLHDDEPWIDVDVEQQVLVAYRGDQPVFATLVSTGRARPTSATPLGEFRIWVKLAFSDMSNLSDDNARRYYAMEQVPWVQYFEEANGLHAAFWHDDFGRRRSHGCVNLAPRDARFLYGLTEPEVPPGWDAAFSTDQHPGSIVRVR